MDCRGAIALQVGQPAFTLRHKSAMLLSACSRPVLRRNVPVPLRSPSRWRWRGGSAVRASSADVGGEVDAARASNAGAGEEGGRLADKLRAWKDNRVNKQMVRSEHFEQVGNPPGRTLNPT